MKKFFAVFLVFFVCLAVRQAVSAATAPAINELTSKVGGQAGYNTNVDEYEISRIMGRVVQGAMVLLGMIFLVLTIYAGFLWMTAGGNEESVTKAQSILKAAVIGLIIVLSSYGITVFVAMVAGSSSNNGFWGTFYDNGFTLFNGQSVF